MKLIPPPPQHTKFYINNNNNNNNKNNNNMKVQENAKEAVATSATLNEPQE